MEVLKMQRVDDRFHATFSATSRQYLYVIPLSVSVESLEAQEYAIVLQEELDYKALSSGAIQTKDSLCTIQSATVSY